ncbi:uncharacterized protein FTOL_03609 [Fusarium torulosum]|uniref:Uncharacterized protein n=1 Tax=Fusarium torulosum TaxID=33205 RepID=A0AAE8M4C6_9HYPO|nr:uncharacterized protein FTOL_03609 [Fusarium torulosum]
MKFTTALFAIASAVTIVSASPAPAAAPEPVPFMSEEAVSKVPRNELLPRQACRGTNCVVCAWLLWGSTQGISRNTSVVSSRVGMVCLEACCRNSFVDGAP